MPAIIAEIWEYHFWSAAALISIASAGVSIFGESRRTRRTHIEAVGFMPWPAITAISTLIGLVAIALAIKTEYFT